MREESNKEALARIFASNPLWIDVQQAKDAIPGMTDKTILHSGPPIAWSRMQGGQRNAVLGACLYEGLASTIEEADEKIVCGEIKVVPCQDHHVVGSLAGVYYPSMPVFVIRNETYGNLSFCSIYESPERRRLTYGVYDEGVHQRLDFIKDVVAPVLQQVVSRLGGLPLKPIMRRALNMGDELHSRNTAATMIFLREIMTELVELSIDDKEKVIQTIEFIKRSDLFFLHLAMAASKSTADAIYNIDKCSIVTAMALNGEEIGIRVSGLGNQWFTAPIPPAEAKLFDGIKENELAYMGGESLINETMGLGGFAQASAFTLQDYSGGTPEKMVENNRLMYEITLADHPDFRIPYFGFRGVPIGIDIFLVAWKRIPPVINMGMSHKEGGHAGAGLLRVPLEIFDKAVEAYKQYYGG